MDIFKTTGVAAGLIAAGTLIGASLSTFASVFDWSTTPATNATADPNINWAEGMLPSSVNDSARATMAAIAAFVKDQGGNVNPGGTGNNFTLALTQPMQAWTPGVFGFRTNRSNTGAATMSVNGLTPKPLRLTSGVDLQAGQLLNTTFYFATYYQPSDEVLIVGKSAITSSDFAPVPALTVKANITGSSASPTDASLAAFFGAAPAASIPQTALNTGYPGQVIWMQATSCPTGWIASDGTAGSPDLRGAFVRGLDNGRGLDSGRTLASFQADGLGSHTHTITDPGHAHTVALLAGAAQAGFNNAVPFGGGATLESTSTNTTGITINATGGTETRPKNVALLACYHG